MSFPITEIGKVANFINGFPFKLEDWETTGLPIIRIQNLTNPVKPYNLTTRKVPERYIVKHGDILVSWSATIDVFEWEHGDALLNQHIFKVEFDHTKIDKQYFKQVLKKTITDLSKHAHGSTMKHVVKKDFENHQIPLPSLNDQIRIAHLLSKVEGLIAQRKQHLQQLDDLLKSVFLEMFGDPVRNERGWSKLPFNEVGQFKSGGTPSKSRDDFWVGNFPWVSPKDMKVSKIVDAEDHISESVFTETNLKRIAPNHLLIVVRGMILAHSFPLAINTVPVAINQDMKAIKPNKEVLAIYLQHCLVSSKRQILELISTAGHGTKKFDSVAMQKLIIPIPPIELQNRFAEIVEKIEGIKARYQTSLVCLEHLYGVLSQQAFKGELDLSRIPTTTFKEEVQTEIKEQTQTEETSPFQISRPPVNNEFDYIFHRPEDIKDLNKAEGRLKLVKQWLNTSLAKENINDGYFSLAKFMDAATIQLEKLIEEIANIKITPESTELLRAAQTQAEELRYSNTQLLGLAEYEIFKKYIFERLEHKKLSQVYESVNNQVRIKVQ